MVMISYCDFCANYPWRVNPDGSIPLKNLAFENLLILAGFSGLDSLRPVPKIY